MQKYVPIILLLLILTTKISTLSLVRASSTSSIDATVKISICGNNVAEGGEECDNSDLNNMNCSSLGYGGGILTCDIACEFNASSCVLTAPTDTPSSNTITDVLSEPIAQQFPTDAPVQIIETDISSLPLALRAFDLTNSGKIELSQLPTVLSLWVQEWKQMLAGALDPETDTLKCDVNNDKTCTIEDLSVLLYYVY